MRFGALKIVSSYLTVSLLWIIFSDRLLFYVINHVEEPGYFRVINTTKGFLFVSLSSVFLYYLIRWNNIKLNQSEAQYRDMYESNPNPMWIYNAQTLLVISVNDAAVAAYGYSKLDWLRKSILDIRPAEDAAKVLASARSLEGNLNQSGIWRHIKNDGTLIHVNITSHKIWFNKVQGVVVMARDMTERVLFEQQLARVNVDLQEQKQKLSETQLISKVGGWEYYPHNSKLVWSDELYLLTGIRRDDTREVFDIYVEHIFPEDREMMIRGLQDLILYQKPLDVTHRISSLEGKTLYIRQLARIEQDTGPVTKVIGSMQDITELKMLQVEKDKYRHEFEDTLNSISDAFFALDKDMIITRTNEPFLALIGIRYHVIGKHIFSIFPKEQNSFYPSYVKALRERVIVKTEDYSTLLHKWLRLAAYPTDEGVSVYFSDISENKLKDIKLKEAVERYDLVAQATKDVIYDLDMVNNEIIYNTRLTQLIQIPVEKIAYTLEWWRSLIHPDDVAEVSESQDIVKNEGKTNWVCEYRINCGQAGYRYIIDQGYFVFNETGQPIRLIGALKDIDELKRTGQENKRLADIITRVNNMIIVTDSCNRVTWVNRAFEDLSGFNLPEILGRRPFEFLIGPNEENDGISKLRELIEEREAFVIDIVIYSASKQPIWVSAEFTPLLDDRKEYAGYIAVYQNISTRKEKETEIARQNDFLKEIAWMSSHQIRRPVASLIGLVNLLQTAETEQEREEMLPMIDQCVKEMDNTVREITRKLDNAVKDERTDNSVTL
jgi:PAS domain S-box-containing protein